MQGLGFKIVDKDRREIEPIVARAADEGRPIEVGLYYGDAETLAYLESTLPGLDLPVVVHLNHRRLSLTQFPGREKALREQLAQAVRLGAGYVITHAAPYPVSVRPEYRAATLARITGGAGIVVAEAARAGLAVHLENTFHDLGFYRGLFEQIDKHQPGGIHHCFDLGHAKVWSTGTLGDWLDLLEARRANGSRLHFHLHANQGLVDEHLSFVRAEALGIVGRDPFCTEGDYWHGISEIERRFPEAVKIFEVPSAEALANMDLALDRLDRHPSVNAA